ncbi:larval cuticle protein 4 [Drosophila tropicalis]|uniref:larval cuticle protein 4 n=1 Tax=Drosophila tropicalis TaxID=46794 RepID=UPI0035AC1EDC
MMKAYSSLVLLAVALLSSSILAVPAPPLNEDSITKFLSNANLDGSYSYDIQQASGQVRAEEGQAGVAVRGYYAYTSPEGIPIQVTYEADENGFRPQSDVLPTPPPIPEAILRAIRFIQEHPTPEELADREVRRHQI